MSEIHLLNARVAHVELFIGPMYSGKTSALKQKIDQYRRFSDVNTITLKHQRDTRHSDDTVITTHSGDNRPATQVHDLREFIKTPEYRKARVIFLDEGHFFEDYGLRSFVKRVIRNRKILYISSLDSDFKGHPFRTVLGLIPMADEVRKFQAACDRCQMPAAHSYRQPSEQEKRIQPGGSAEGYESLCHRCFYKTARTNSNKAQKLKSDRKESTETSQGQRRALKIGWRENGEQKVVTSKVYSVFEKTEGEQDSD